MLVYEGRLNIQRLSRYFCRSYFLYGCANVQTKAEVTVDGLPLSLGRGSNQDWNQCTPPPLDRGSGIPDYTCFWFCVASPCTLQRHVNCKGRRQE